MGTYREGTPYTHSASDWEVTETASDWGSPVGTVRMTGGPFAGEIYRLRTTKGMPSPLAGTIERHRYHLDLIGRHGEVASDRGDWYGAFDTDDLGQALSELMTELDLWAADAAVHWELDGKLARLRELLGDALEYDQRRTHRSLRRRWPDIRDVYLALEMGFFQKSDGPAIPPAPRWGWQAPLLVLGRATVDRRILAARGEYTLRENSGALVRTDASTHGQTACGQITHLVRSGHLVWAYGTCDNEATAADITAGRLFLSAALLWDDSSDVDTTGGLFVWHGARVTGAHLMLPDQNLWGGWHA